MKEMTVTEFARKGGKALLKKYGKAHFSKMGKMGRGKKKKKK